MFIVGRTVARGSRSRGFLEHRLELRERSLFRVKRMRYAQGDRLVALPVTKRRAEYDGNADGGEALGHRFVPAVVVLAGSGEIGRASCREGVRVRAGGGSVAGKEA